MKYPADTYNVMTVLSPFLEMIKFYVDNNHLWKLSEMSVLAAK